MKEIRGSRRSLSTNLELRFNLSRLEFLGRQPSQDILSRSGSQKSLSEHSLKLPRRQSQGTRSNKSMSELNDKRKPLKPIDKLPPVQINEKKPKLTNRLKLTVKTQPTDSSTMRPAESLQQLMTDLQNSAHGRFFYVEFDNYLNYRLVQSSGRKALDHEYSTISGQGILLNDLEATTTFIPAEQVPKRVAILRKLRENDVFGHFLICKIFRRWKKVINAKYYLRGRRLLQRTLDVLDSDLRQALELCVQQIQQLSARRLISIINFEPIALGKYGEYLQSCSTRARNFLTTRQFGSVIRQALAPINKKIEKSLDLEHRMRNTSRFNVASAFDSRLAYGGAFRFIRKMVYIINNAKIKYLHSCYDQFIAKIAKSLKLYLDKDRQPVFQFVTAVLNGQGQSDFAMLSSDRHKQIDSIAVELSLEGFTLCCKTTEKAVMDVLSHFLNNLTPRVSVPTDQLDGFDEVLRQLIGEVFKSADTYDTGGLADSARKFGMVRDQLGKTIRSNFDEVYALIGLYRQLMEEIGEHLSNKSSDGYQSRLEDLKTFMAKCQKGLVDVSVGFLSIRTGNVQKQLLSILQRQQALINQQIPIEFNEQCKQTGSLISDFSGKIKHSVTDIENFVECYRRVEEYEAAKESISRSQDRLKQLLGVLQQIRHPERPHLVNQHAQLDSALAQLQVKVKLFRNKVQQQAQSLRKQSNQLATQVYTRLRNIQTKCLQSLDYPLGQLLGIFRRQMQVLKEVERDIENVSVVQKLFACQKRTQFPLATILAYQLENLVDLLELYQLHHQMTNAVAETSFREIDLSLPISFGEDLVCRLRNKIKPLHQFDRLLLRLIDYFLRLNETFKTVRNLQMLDHRDLRYMEEASVSPTAQRLFEECLVKNFSLSGLLAANVHQLYEPSAELVKRKDRQSQLQALLQSVQTDWQALGFRVAHQAVMQIFSNLSALIDKLEQYQLQFNMLSPHRVSHSLQQRVDLNSRKIGYCVNFLNNFKKVQDQLLSACSVIVTAGSFDIYAKDSKEFSGSIINWVKFVGQMKTLKLDKVGRDWQHKTLQAQVNALSQSVGQLHQYLNEVTRKRCLDFPKLFFFSKSDILKIFENKTLFFTEYYRSIESAVQEEDQLVLRTVYGETIRFVCDPESTDYLHKYDQQLCKYIQTTLLQWIELKDETIFTRMLKDRALGQLIICVDYIDGCQRLKRLLKLYNNEGEPNTEQYRRFSDDILSLSKMLRSFASKMSPQYKYETTVLQTLIMQRAYLRQRYSLAYSDSFDLTLALQQKDMDIWLTTAGYALKLQYEPIDANSFLMIYPQTEKSYYHLLSNISDRMGGMLQNAHLLKDLACMAMRKLVRVKVTETNYAMMLMGAVNTDAWCYFDIFSDDKLGLLATISDIIIKIRSALRSNKPTTTYGPHTFQMCTQPILFTCAEQPNEIPSHIKVYFRPIYWQPPSFSQIAQTVFSVKGMKQKDVLNVTKKFIILLEEKVKDNKVQMGHFVVWKTIDQFVEKYVRSKPIKGQLTEAAKKVMGFTSCFQIQLQAVESADLRQTLYENKSQNRHTIIQANPQPNPFSDKVKQFFSAIQLNSTVFLVGQQMSGKTSILQAAQQQLKCKIHCDHINLDTLSPADLKSFMNLDNAGSFHYMFNMMTSSESEKWVVLDSFFHPKTIGYFQEIFSRERLAYASNGQKIPISASTKFIFEVQSMSNVPPNVVFHASKVILQPNLVTLKQFFTRKSDLLLQNNMVARFHNSLKEEYAKIFNNIEPLFESQFKPLLFLKPINPKFIVEHVFSLIRSLLPTKESTEGMNSFSMISATHRAFYYALAVTLNMLTAQDERKNIDRLVKQDLLKKQYFSRNALLDCIFDSSTRKEGVMVTPDLNETVLPFNELDTAFVHTQQTLISRSILLTLLTHNENIMVFGPSGSCKTSFLKATLKDIKILKAWLNMNMKCNSRTLAEVMERAMGKACISQDKEILGKTQRLFTGPILSNKQALIIVEDIWLAQNPRQINEQLRSVIQRQSVFSLIANSFLQVSKLQFLATNNSQASSFYFNRYLFPFKFDCNTQQYTEQIYTAVLTSALGKAISVCGNCQSRELLKRVPELSRAAIGVLKVLNDVRASSRQSMFINRTLFRFDWIKRSLILIFKHFLDEGLVADSDDIFGLLSYSLIFGLSSNTQTDKQYSDLVSLVNSKTKDIMAEIYPGKKLELQYIFRMEDGRAVWLERDSLEEEVRNRLRKKLKSGSFIHYNTEIIDLINELSLAINLKQNILLLNSDRLPTELPLSNILQLLGQECLVIPKHFTPDQLVDTIRYVLTKRVVLPAPLFYLIFEAPHRCTHFHALMSILQQVTANEDEETFEYQGKPIVVQDFVKRVRYVYCYENGVKQAFLKEQYGSLLGSAWRVAVRKTSQKSIGSLIQKAVSQAIFTQSGKFAPPRNSQAMVRWQRISGMMQHRRLSARPSFSASELGKQASLIKQIRDTIHRTFELSEKIDLSKAKPFVLEYFNKQHRFSMFLEHFSVLVDAKQNALMFNKSLLESSKQRLNDLLQRVRLYKQHYIEVIQNLRHANNELTETMRRKESCHEEYRTELENFSQIQHDLKDLEQLVESKRRQIIMKRNNIKQNKDNSQGAFLNITRSDISQMKAQFTNNYETLSMFYESLCLIFGQSPDMAGVKRIIFDANFKGKLKDIKFSKLQEGVLRQIRFRLQNTKADKLLSIKSLFQWILYGVQSELLKRRLKSDADQLEFEINSNLKKMELMKARLNSPSVLQYQSLCERETELREKIKTLQKSKQSFESKDKQMEKLEKFKVIRAGWLKLKEKLRHQEEFLFFKCIKTAFLLVFGGLLTLQQRRSLRNVMTSLLHKSNLIKPTQFQIQQFLSDMCSSNLQLQSQNLSIILYTLEQTNFQLLLLSSPFELGIFFRQANCVHTNLTHFKEVLQKCVTEGKWMFVHLDGSDDGLPNELEILAKRQYQYRNKKPCLRVNSKLVEINSTFRLILVKTNIEKYMSWMDNMVLVEFRLREQEIQSPICQQLLLRFANFDHPEEKKKLRRLEEQAEDVLWTVLKQLAKQLTMTPISDRSLDSFMVLIKQQQQVRNSITMTFESINKIYVCEKDLVQLSTDLAKILKLYVGLVEGKQQFEISIELFMKIVFDSITSNSRDSTRLQTIEERRSNILNVETVLALVTQRLSSILDQSTSQLFFYCLFWKQQMNNQNRVTQQQLQNILFTPSNLQELQLQIVSSGLQRSGAKLKMIPNRKKQFQSFCNHIFKNSITDEEIILNQLHKLKLSYGDMLMMKKYVLPKVFEKEVIGGVEKYKGVGSLEWKRLIITFEKTIFWKDYLNGEKMQSLCLSDIVKTKKMHYSVTKRLLFIFDDCFEKIDHDRIQKVLNKIDQNVKIVLVLKDVRSIHNEVLIKTKRINFSWIAMMFKNDILSFCQEKSTNSELKDQYLAFFNRLHKQNQQILLPSFVSSLQHINQLLRNQKLGQNLILNSVLLDIISDSSQADMAKQISKVMSSSVSKVNNTGQMLRTFGFAQNPYTITEVYDKAKSILSFIEQNMSLIKEQSHSIVTEFQQAFQTIHKIEQITRGKKELTYENCKIMMDNDAEKQLKKLKQKIIQFMTLRNAAVASAELESTQQWVRKTGQFGERKNSKTRLRISKRESSKDRERAMSGFLAGMLFKTK